MFIISEAFSSLVKEALDRDISLQNSVEVTGQANIKVIGCGGAGCNAVNWLYKKGVKGADIIAINTDKQQLDLIEADRKLLIGKETTRGLGCGGFPDKGLEAAKEQVKEIKQILDGSDMIFLTAGLGGGTGTGSSPLVGKIAKEAGAIVIGVVTMPFDIERTRIEKAELGLKELRKVCNTVVVIDNNKLVELAGNLPITQAFAVANELISTMIKSIVEIIAVPSLVNLDYADVKAIMTSGEVSVIGFGESDSANRVKESVEKALKHPLLDVSYDNATGALIHVTGGPSLTLDEINQIGELITKNLSPDANVIWGSRIDNTLDKKIRVMTIVTGVTSPHILGRPMIPTKKVYNKDLNIDFIGYERA